MSSGGLTTAGNSSDPNHVPIDESKHIIDAGKEGTPCEQRSGYAPYFRSAGEYSDASNTLRAKF